jgi:hypothetical protein
MHTASNVIKDCINMHRAPEAGKKNRSSKPKVLAHEQENGRFGDGAVWVFRRNEMEIAEARYKKILTCDPNADNPKSIWGPMKSAENIRFAVRWARFCFDGLGSKSHTDNTLAIFDIIGEVLQSTISTRYATQNLLPRFVLLAAEREGLFPEVQCTITIHWLYHIIEVSDC